MLGVWYSMSGFASLSSLGMRSAGGAKMGGEAEGESSEVTALTPSLEALDMSV